MLRDSADEFAARVDVPPRESSGSPSLAQEDLRLGGLPRFSVNQQPPRDYGAPGRNLDDSRPFRTFRGTQWPRATQRGSAPPPTYDAWPQSSVHDALPPSRIPDQPLDAWVRERTDDARKLGTHEECKVAIGALMEELGKRRLRNKLPMQACNTELLGLVKALMDDALARSPGSACKETIDYLDSKVAWLSTSKAVNTEMVEGLKAEVEKYKENGTQPPPAPFTQPALQLR